MNVIWEPSAARLAEEVTPPASPWRNAVVSTPRHLLVPCWWAEVDSDDYRWELRDGPSGDREWLSTTYSDETLITKVGVLHADHARASDHPSGPMTSSSTLPSLVVRMLSHGHIYPGADVLDVATGSGYSAALLSHLLGDSHVTSIDVDPYLTKVATERLDQIGLHPHVTTCDATGPLPGTYDRLVSMVSVRPIPASWLEGLRPGGRLVTTITNMSIIITAEKTNDGRAVGRVERDWAMFMATRTGTDYPPPLKDMFEQIRDQEGEHVTKGLYPVVDVVESWELRTMLELAAPGVEHHYEGSIAGPRTAWMLHRDGSWARAQAVGHAPPTVHQSGPRRLWDALESVRTHWLRRGHFPLYGANVEITPEGICHLTRGRWQATID
jgi:protein-L-isoaspartate O-methyltransferase